ncbi:MAG: ribonuclease Z [Ruminococcaceae bacterium]|nr:ribonuclease Z [Oscillospiraceae bacterium]
MKLIFFGSSHGVPEANRRCSSTLIEVGENRYFIDMGTQSIEQLITRNIPIESVKAVFVTHMHGDHSNGLISFIDLCNWYFKKAAPTVCLPGDMERAKNAIAAWLSCNGTAMRDLDFRRVEEGVVFDDGTLRVTAYRTKHIEYSYAYLVEAEGKRVLFSGDLCHKGPANDFPIEVLDSPLDLAICESAHFKATEYIPLLKGNKNLKKLCFNHYSYAFLASVLEAKAVFSQDIDTLLATDGTEIEI